MPNITHADQLMTYWLWYVSHDQHPVKRFFFKLQGIYRHTAEYLTITIDEWIENFNINIKNWVARNTKTLVIWLESAQDYKQK